MAKANGGICCWAKQTLNCSLAVTFMLVWRVDYYLSSNIQNPLRVFELGVDVIIDVILPEVVTLSGLWSDSSWNCPAWQWRAFSKMVGSTTARIEILLLRRTVRNDNVFVLTRGGCLWNWYNSIQIDGKSWRLYSVLGTKTFRVNWVTNFLVLLRRAVKMLPWQDVQVILTISESDWPWSGRKSRRDWTLNWHGSGADIQWLSILLPATTVTWTRKCHRSHCRRSGCLECSSRLWARSESLESHQTLARSWRNCK